MILSRTSQYAVQALVYLATQPADRYLLTREIAQALGVPHAYLAKILQKLCRQRLVVSSRGRTGGFMLCAGAQQTNLLDIMLFTEGVRITRECLLGLKQCSDVTACPVHSKWKPIKLKMLAYLDHVNVGLLAKAVQGGRYRLCDLPQALLRP